MQIARILAIGDTSPDFAELMRLLRQQHVVFWAQSMTDIERAVEQPPTLIIAERKRLQRLNFEAVSAMIPNSETPWMLLDNDSAVEDDAFLSRMYSVIPLPYAPQMACQLALRAIEHIRLAEEYERLAQTVQELNAAHARASEPSGVSQQAACEQMVAQTFGEMMNSEKFTTLGQMLAGIVHEINTPSGAINAAISNVRHYLKHLLESGIAVDRLGMKSDDFRMMLRMMAKMLDALEDKPRRHSGEIRGEQKEIAELLAQRNIPNAAKLAREIARLGVTPWLDDVLALLQAYPGEHLLAFLTSWHRIIHSVQDIRLSNEMLTRIVRAVKSYSYPWQDRLELADIRESLDMALTLLSSKLKHHITVTTDFADVPVIPCNLPDLTHVWLNLLQNAIQAIDGEGSIRLEIFAAQAHVGVRVIDTGKGIPADILPKIFAPNFTTKSREEGTGLGLYLVRQILDKHHGTIEVSSVPGQTVFEVRLPR